MTGTTAAPDQDQASPLGWVLQNMPDADRRAELAQLAAEHRIQPDDPLWVVLRTTVLNERWCREDQERREAGTRNMLKRIEQATRAGERRLATRSEEEFGAAQGQMVIALNELTDRAALDIQDRTDSAIQAASLGRWRGWVLPIIAAVVTGLLSAVAVAMLNQADDIQGRLNASDRQALEVGRDFLSTWWRTPKSEQQALLERLGWSISTESPADQSDSPADP